MIRPYYTLPDVPDAGLLQRYLDTLSVIVPLARTNMVLNPVLRNNSTGWTGMPNSTFTSGFPATFNYYHAFGADVEPIAAGATYGIYYLTSTLTSGVTYVASVKFKQLKALGNPTYAIAFATTGGVDLVTYRFRATGLWQWIYVFWKETSTTTRRIYIRRDDAGGGLAAQDQFLISGLQLESCADGIMKPTTYIDGDQQGLIPNQFPVPYAWNGAPHASSSYRTASTRAGGYSMRFRDFGFLLTAIIGLGLAPPQHEALAFAQLDGGQYQNTIKPPRQFSIAGRWAAPTPTSIDSGIGALSALLDRDLVIPRQPLLLTAQAMDCDRAIGETVWIQALYQAGLEGNVQELPTATQPITFTQYLPMLTGGMNAAALVVQQSVTADRALRRTPDGTWQALSTGLGTIGALSVQTIAVLQDGRIFLGGDFTAASGAPDSYGILYNPTTNTFSLMGGGGQLTGMILGSAVGPNGILYLVGGFINAAGIANADNIVAYNPTTNTFAALGTGANGQVNTVAVGPTGLVYAGAANFVDMGGVANTNGFGVWDGATWAAMGTGISGVGSIFAILPIRSRVYLGGSMTVMGGVANTQRVAYWDGTTYVSQTDTPPDSSVFTIVQAANGMLLYGGLFTDNQAYWNGVTFQYLSGLAGSVNNQDVNPIDGTVWLGGDFTSVGAVALPDSLARLVGNVTYVPADVNLPGTASIKDVRITPGGDLYVGFSTDGAATAAGITPLTNTGTADAYPKLVIIGPISGATARIYQLVNTTTGAAIYFNYTINAGEVAVLNLDPTNVTFSSSYQGNIIDTILPGSTPTNFALQPGVNNISFFSDSAFVAATLEWQIGYVSINNALAQGTP